MVGKVEVLEFAFCSWRLLVRHHCKPFIVILVSSIPFEFYFRSSWQGLIVVLLVSRLYFVLLKLWFIAWRALERYIRYFMLGIWTLLLFRRWYWSLELIFICSGIIKSSRWLKSIMWYLISFVDELILFRIIIIL